MIHAYSPHLPIAERLLAAGQPHKRIVGDSDFVTIEVEINIYAGSVHEAGMDVNL